MLAAPPLLLLLLLQSTAELFHAPSLLETLCCLSRSLGTGGVVLYGGAHHPGETGEVSLLRGLALRRVPVAWARLGAATPGGGHSWGRRPLAVLLAADHGTAAWLDQVSLLRGLALRRVPVAWARLGAATPGGGHSWGRRPLAVLLAADHGTAAWLDQVSLLRGLALRRVPVAWARLGAATPGGGHSWGRRPLAVLLAADHGTAAWLDQVSLLRGLALRRVPVAWARLGAATPGGGHSWGRRPLAVLLAAEHGTAAWLDQVSLLRGLALRRVPVAWARLGAATPGGGHRFLQ
ncbi:uncharacterized protein LOC134532449 [Bacillus rossius redtenbacheri]|uniref:uncharacterized protein LOC134532449 n=1 Tax=Bacillus rossius redtenbacheri TaxID=93214 RepID=UPI002FDCCC3A